MMVDNPRRFSDASFIYIYVKQQFWHIHFFVINIHDKTVSAIGSTARTLNSELENFYHKVKEILQEN